MILHYLCSQLRLYLAPHNKPVTTYRCIYNSSWDNPRPLSHHNRSFQSQRNRLQRLNNRLLLHNLNRSQCNRRWKYLWVVIINRTLIYVPHICVLLKELCDQYRCLRPPLLTWITEIRTRVTDYILWFMWLVVSHQCPDFNSQTTVKPLV